MLAFIVLTSMVLHCASRLGVLSYLYQERHLIAYQLGFISEIPIALCNSSYHYNRELHIADDAKGDHLPISHLHTQEIHLFFSTPDLRLAEMVVIPQTANTPYRVKAYTPHRSGVFHPPGISSAVA